ncbi:hypothetical protein ACL02T_12955 [Pseudonocardia sp. RS010]|uniref:hypothetical protein n=1 Tax=Pseudonocardia sp. RS010 TaxID=3385979 RepID=UPI00399F3F5D
MEKPADLGAAGASLWDEVLSDPTLVLRPDEYRTLELACRQLDTISELRAVFAANPEHVVSGSMKQKVINPLIAEIRVAGESYARYMKQLGLPDDEVRANQKAEQQAEYFRRLANLRWEKNGD